MGFPALDVDQKTHATGVVLKLRVVKPLFRGRTGQFAAPGFRLPFFFAHLFGKLM
jgi:hypothetical protein